MDSIMIANECIDGHRRNREPGVVCKLDMEKAYDRVDWDFLFWGFRRKGFGERWIFWISGCVLEPYFSILINGTSKEFFKSSRGLRQGDPLSPFLFTLVGDELSTLLKRVEMVGLVEGFEGGDERIMVSHLQFANDTILLLKEEKENIRNMDVFEDFLSYLQVEGEHG